MALRAGIFFCLFEGCFWAGGIKTFYLAVGVLRGESSLFGSLAASPLAWIINAWLLLLSPIFFAAFIDAAARAVAERRLA